MNGRTQGVFSGQDPFTQTASQLIQSASGNVSRTSAFNSEFDSLGNRLVPLSGNGFIAPIDFEADYSFDGLGAELGKEYAINYTPILAIAGDPYAQEPIVNLHRTIGSFDYRIPKATYTINHDSDLQTGAFGSTTSAISQVFDSDVLIRSSPERAARLETSMGDRPTITQFFDFPGLNTIDQRATLLLRSEFQRLQVSYGANLNITTNPSILTGTRVQSTLRVANCYSGGLGHLD
jgi:hypothetical protein